MNSPHPMSKKCGKKNRSGGTCGLWAMHGQSVCYMHGGKSPQALAKAEQRMRALVHPAIDALERMIDANEFPATKYVLDWAGFRPSESDALPDSAPMQVTVIFDRADQNQPPTLALNGHAE